MINYENMMKRTVIVSIILLIFTGIFSGCQEKQPLDPGNNLLGEGFQFRDATLDTFRIQRDSIDITYENNPYNPVGNFRNYTAKSLLRFTGFEVLDLIGFERFESVELVFPVARTIRDTAAAMTVALYRNRVVFPDTGDIGVSTILGYNPDPSDLIDSVRYPDDADTLDQLTFEVSPDLINTWRDDSTSNQGMILQSPSSTGILFANSEEVGSDEPFLRATIVDTADSVRQISLSALTDLGAIGGGEVPEIDANDAILRQVNAFRLAIGFPGIGDTIPAQSAFIHSARLSIPVDQDRSYAYDDNHQIVVSTMADTTKLLSTGGSGVTYSVTAEDSVLLIDDRNIRDFIQSLLDGSREPETNIVLYYTQEGQGIDHLYLHTARTELEVVFSEVDE